MFLGVDGGGTKTAFVLIDGQGNVRARHQENSSYYLEVGMENTAAILRQGTAATLAKAGLQPDDLSFAFFGLPAFGEDSSVEQQLDSLPAGFLARDKYQCGCDMICSWAGSLACQDGVSVISGTGSMAYGEYQGRGTRAGGWGELFSDEGSAYWIAREGLTLFSKMSDGRAVKGILHELFMQRFKLKEELDLCGHVYSTLGAQRSAIAQISQLVAEAALAGDDQARMIFFRAALELADMVMAVRKVLQVPDSVIFPVSYSGGVFDGGSLLLEPFTQQLQQRHFEVRKPILTPAIGAAMYAAKCAGADLDAAAIAKLAAASAV
ncbi:N-acetylglucosamine kinase-like BadF-type ATPase [Oxalobacteraceae bacterium GrIS 2.11]